MEQSTDVKYVASSFQIHEFSSVVMSTDVYFKVIKMKDSVFIWIGDNQHMFNDLSYGLYSDICKNVCTTRILGLSSTDTISTLSHNLAKKLRKAAYVSFNLTVNASLSMQIVARLLEEIDCNPDKF